MNKRVLRLVTALLAVLVLAQAGGVAALADGESYQVRIYAGNVGATIGGGSVWSASAGYGQDITFDPSWVQLPADSPYYVRGIRKSGLDNNTVSNNVIHVTEDTDYVVAYGIRGALVAYTVSYVNAAGEMLAPSQTYYGNAGDKPVVAYLYVDGYQPQAYNLTRTLSDNAADNVFTFVYSPIVRPTAVPAPAGGSAGGGTSGGTSGSTSGGTSGGTSTGGSTSGSAATAAPGSTAAPGDTAVPGDTGESGTVVTTAPGGQAAEAAGETGGGTDAAPEQQQAVPVQQTAPAEQVEIEDEDVPLNETPKDLIDLDDEDTPLGKAPVTQEKTELQKEREQKQSKFYLATVLMILACAAIVTAAAVLLKRRGAKR